ncbi:hypothetical protein BRARA_I00591 [Brassica rapa]|uniref:Uncharacterized protein n=1 Tax=Brassica campestris TaxID=3711 RepID=A0A397XRP5_BRACM|nr:hypothetical protein BRARA_I00591 [Brassica rapa]
MSGADEGLCVLFASRVHHVDVNLFIVVVVVARRQRDDKCLVPRGTRVVLFVDSGGEFVLGIDPYDGVWLVWTVAPVHVLDILC